MPSVLELVLMPKSFVAKRRPTVHDKPGHRSLDLPLAALSEDGALFVYVRQNLRRVEDYSTGLRWVSPRARPQMLVRVNGPSHVHGNPDGAKLVQVAHVHVDIPDLGQGPVENLRWAYELEAPFTSLPEAFRLLTEVTRITPSSFVTRAVRMLAGGEQLDLDLHGDDDDT